MRIGLDMMGGDFAPTEAVKGVKLFLDTVASDVHLVLIGDEAQLTPLLSVAQLDQSRYSVVHSSQVIGMNEHPTKALKEKPQSSISIGFHLLKNEQIDAFISAGNTGAMMVGTFYSIKAIEGVQRPTISTLVPRENGGYGLLLDVGINADCKPENLSQFAILGSLYSKHILNIDNPRVGLLNIGEEEGKGNLLAMATYPLLKENKQVNFIGNIEGRDIFTDKADVIVCEGFTGNVVLKMAESFHEVAVRRNIQDEYLDKFNFEAYGGTPVLGVSKPVIIGHGISQGLAFKNMIQLAKQINESKLLEKIKESFTQSV
ncbi:phosphate:acyl-[acyl carrier protein] acyltransferase [Chitinophaga terrae (ex Kim and Jung 2007)]|jgi:glycerol-3-phosphate acyltransferase PlsX|uniref:Phosphate acyltransferase n=1 Tax=Chitinophaga terrae (ex Kim and Jung 2007) TaxID=408074 RepID=A0A1H3X2P9_9BACT|nr:phosphate acyltransferase PlsX [Chitinophaga terrae (ex Kim and Jung 2007)]MDQ0106933.1 glycerol-3-phosphate acyltransferase PlsX [Chitinophaga terrae (ex Kim and Jung 2007)]GEP90179.1 phosphate acyltransferase [Chitinophaga terrae (ex Kim and Jung 2007)]SDZ93251.1 phosphate:acyl-[acyl carrier protein] acyltransferase [Chitinophaga terrae (ex Kim and Jung 2007)]